jgi:signal transduction histidine kinase
MEHDEKKVHLLETIERNNDKLMDMIKTASEFAKLEDIEEIEFKDLDIGSLVAEVIADFKTQLEEKKMDVELRAKGEYPAKANPAIEEVFANLISNAIKYSPVQSKTIIDITDEGDLWKVTVTDFGEGISDEDKPKLFERFKRVGKGGVKGTGLGLAIVKRIIDLHGGSVGVEDNPEGKGSVFWVTIKKT